MLPLKGNFIIKEIRKWWNKGLILVHMVSC